MANDLNVGETKLVNLCEDMDFHEHDEKSYVRQKSIQDKIEQNERNIRLEDRENKNK